MSEIKKKNEYDMKKYTGAPGKRMCGQNAFNINSLIRN